MRQVARIDKNQPAIVQALRGMGAEVLHTHTLGKGAPDIIVGHHGVNYLFEIKDPAQPKSKRHLTDDEQEFHARWRGTVYVIESFEDAQKILEAGSE